MKQELTTEIKIFITSMNTCTVCYSTHPNILQLSRKM